MSLQNKNDEDCKSKNHNKCNGKLQDVSGTTLEHLEHLDLDVDDELCIWYETDDEKFTETPCNSQAWVICEKVAQPRKAIIN